VQVQLHPLLLLLPLVHLLVRVEHLLLVLLLVVVGGLLHPHPLVPLVPAAACKAR
jgi:hypothetical protein